MKATPLILALALWLPHIMPSGRVSVRSLNSTIPPLTKSTPITLDQALSEFTTAARSGTIPDCPVVTKHTAALAEELGEPSTYADTRSTACNGPDSPPPVRCPPGFTIHLETKTCRDGLCPTKDTAWPEDGVPASRGSVVVGFMCQLYFL